MVSVPTTQCHHCSRKATIDNMQMDGSNCITKLYLQKQRTGWIWQAGYHLPTSALEPLPHEVCGPRSSRISIARSLPEMLTLRPTQLCRISLRGEGATQRVFPSTPHRSSLRSPSSHPCFLPGAPGTRDFRGLSDGSDLTKDLFQSHKEHKISQYSPHITEEHSWSRGHQSKAEANPSRTA